MSTVGLHAFNLLPYRSGARRRARNRALALLAGASVTGCAAVGVLAGWDALERARIDESRGALDVALAQLNTPVAEHARLVEQEALRRRALSAAAPIAAPRARFLGLLNALALGSSQGNVGLQRVTQRVNEVELAASAADSHAAAVWLKALESVAGVHAVEIVEMRRRDVSPASLRSPAVAKLRPIVASTQDKTGTYDFIAVVRWAESAAGENGPKLLQAGKRAISSSKSTAASRSVR
jgi:type IV pilus assembly protein PilN